MGSAAQKERVTRALAHAQKQLGTAYHFTVQVGAIDKDRAVLWIDRTARGNADRNHFIVAFNPREVETISVADLRKLAGHEVLHAINWGLYEFASGERKGDEQAVADEFENSTYTLQRAFFGEIKD